ncbi:unnamed protein product [Urochloa humidicola]
MISLHPPKPPALSASLSSRTASPSWHPPARRAQAAVRWPPSNSLSVEYPEAAPLLASSVISADAGRGQASAPRAAGLGPARQQAAGDRVSAHLGRGQRRVVKRHGGGAGSGAAREGRRWARSSRVSPSPRRPRWIPSPSPLPPATRRPPRLSLSSLLSRLRVDLAPLTPGLVESSGRASRRRVYNGCGLRRWRGGGFAGGSREDGCDGGPNPFCQRRTSRPARRWSTGRAGLAAMRSSPSHFPTSTPP